MEHRQEKEKKEIDKNEKKERGRKRAKKREEGKGVRTLMVKNLLFVRRENREIKTLFFTNPVLAEGYSYYVPKINPKFLRTPDDQFANF